MENILIPIDKTDVASNALKYATECFPKARFTVIHINDRSLETEDAVINGDKHNSVLKDFICKSLGVVSIPQNITLVIRYGTIVPSIRNYVEQNEFDFVVMGTRDKYNLFDNWFGTVSLGVAKSLSIPTYLIPKYAKFKNFKKVVVATDKHLKEKSFIKMIKNWNDPYNAFLKFLQVKSKDENTTKEVEASIVKELFEEHDVNFGFEIENIQGSNVTGSLLANAYNYGADLMIVIPDTQSYINSLLFQSTSKDLILKSDIPLLFIHNNNFFS